MDPQQSLNFIIKCLNNYVTKQDDGVREVLAHTLEAHVKVLQAAIKPKEESPT